MATLSKNLHMTPFYLDNLCKVDMGRDMGSLSKKRLKSYICPTLRSVRSFTSCS